MDTKRLDLDLLVTLEALLVERNVTKAAARLHLSQPAVSTQLSRLRDMFDDALLIPIQRGMMPTAKAIELFDRCVKPSIRFVPLLQPTGTSTLPRPS
jgi:DNA-binding transcriptional LysR family regulator